MLSGLKNWLWSRHIPIDEPGEDAEVIQLHAERHPADTAVTCACGGSWFQPYAVTFEWDGTVGGWIGPVHCVDCGALITFTGSAS